MKFYRVEQGSADWYNLRLGRPTSSNFHKIVTPKGAPSAQAVKYLYRLVAERLLHETTDDQLAYVDWVQRGKEQEPNAVAQFNFTNEVQLEPGGLFTTDDGRMACSPDRLLRGGAEGVEVKCPAPWTQIEYLLEGPGDEYRPQVQGQMLIAEFRAVHFYSFHPQMPPLHKVTPPDRAYQGVLRSALSSFCDVLDVTTERARMLGAYAVMTRVRRPQDAAYGDPSDAPALTIVNPEEGASSDGI
ncbi:MAG TPA: YqaJ viral recombinase family protein [Stellaceae bacterium]|jgi:hypothetical protein|nr:YqaJ viral recombinase family protein [Stellaceae bacterium]